MNKLITLTLLTLLSLSFVLAGNLENNSHFSPDVSTRNYTLVNDISTTEFTVGDYCFNITSGSYCYYNDFINPGNFTATSYSTDYDITFNTSYIPATGLDCSVYVNGTLFNVQSFSGSNTTQIVSVNFSQEINETLEFFANCQDGQVSYLGYNFSAHVLVDTINPMIITNFNNNSIHLIDNLTAQFNFSDERDLYSWNISIDGSPHAGDTNVNYNFYSYNFTVDPETYTPGLHSLTARVADGHTSNKIGKYKIDQPFLSWDEITYNVDDKGNSITIKPESTNWFDVFTTEKKKDRYSFTYTPSNKNSPKYKNGQLSFIVTSTQPMQIRNNPLVKDVRTWIITGNNWVDFVIVNDTEAISRYRRIDPYTIKVDVSNIKDPSKVTFNSIGELNIVTKEYTFYTLNTTSVFGASVPEQSDVNFSFEVEIGDSPVDVTDISAEFFYNGTSQIVSSTSTSTTIEFTSDLTTPDINEDTNFTVLWNVSYDNVTHSDSELQLVQNIGLRYCNETNDTAAVRFNILDEENNLLIPEVDLNLHISFANMFTDVQFGFNFSGNNSYEICLDPPSASYTINAVMEFEADAYAHRKYYLFDTELDNVTENVTLYLINSSKASDVIVKVYDQSVGAPTVDAIVKVLRYFPELDDGSSAAYKLIEVAQTDIDGQGLTDLVLADVWYKFIVEYPQGTTLSETDIQRVLSTSISLPISLTGDAFAEYDEIARTAGDVVCTPSTQTCRFTWNHVSNTAVTGKLRVYQDTGITKALLHSSDSVAASGSLVYVIPGDTTNKVYIAEGWIEVTN